MQGELGRPAVCSGTAPGEESHDDYCCQTCSAIPTEVLPFRLQAEAVGDTMDYFLSFHGLFSPSLLHKGVLRAQWCKRLPDHTGCSVHHGAVMKYMRVSHQNLMGLVRKPAENHLCMNVRKLI